MTSPQERHMNTTPRTLRLLRLLATPVLVAAVVLTGAGCSGDPDGHGGSSTATTREKAVTFATCMRDNGVAAFPDPGPSGTLTIDEIANEAKIDTDSPAFEKAITACRDLEPAGFTGHKRSAHQQQEALAFAQCMRDHGVADFPDPDPDGPLIDTNRIPSAKGRGALDIPGFREASDACMSAHSGALDKK
jgi:hypothetical protein